MCQLTEPLALAFCLLVKASSVFFGMAGIILLDLHGLHVNESLKILGRELAQLREGAGQAKGRVPVKVHILVGTGHHTKVQQPLLTSAKLTFCYSHTGRSCYSS